ncbi:hypothetical protein EJ02DRAFT_458507 [Clathrospora elynae]|uniref:Uncharacterized protein n=1 Tax=Clathrospora elynae TaxID=706981 RepID=A0A6A5SK33_9PLEO|nr:hypothetical protein EJ02DRAFT_458507 [Clathrospora elynae]
MAAAHTYNLLDYSEDITSFDELDNYAQANFEEDYAKLPDPSTYNITRAFCGARLCIGEASSSAVLKSLTYSGDDTLDVWASLDHRSGALLLTIDSFRIRPIHYNEIKLLEPFCWLWPGIANWIGLDKLDGFVRYVFLARGYPASLEEMPFRIQEVFPQICSDIATAQDMKNMRSVWEGGEVRRDQVYNSGSEDGEHTEEASVGMLDEVKTPDVASESRMRELEDDFKSLTATLDAIHEERDAKKANRRTTTGNSEDDLQAAMEEIFDLAAELAAALKEADKWKKQYERVKQALHVVLEDVF